MVSAKAAATTSLPSTSVYCEAELIMNAWLYLTVLLSALQVGLTLGAPVPSPDEVDGDVSKIIPPDHRPSFYNEQLKNKAL
ncbi:hypothetical protein C8Q75DRAFT_811198 [Abortiporus biennis]|nr:hypothetical protein C8Q75DRAFT_811198 [Abortiporus biennis]